MTKGGGGDTKASAQHLEQTISGENNAHRFDSTPIFFGHGPTTDFAESHSHLIGAIYLVLDRLAETSAEGRPCNSRVTDKEIFETAGMPFVEVAQARTYTAIAINRED